MQKIEEITNGVKSAKENITKHEKALQDAITPLKEFGKNYAEFALKPKEALEKLLQEKNGQVAGAAFRDDLGGIDLVWGKGGKDGYGLAHILERREAQALEYPNITKEQAKDYALSIIHLIPEILENGALRVDANNRITIKHNRFIVGLHDEWMKQKLQNKWVVTSYEVYDENKELRTFLKMPKEKTEDSRELTAISTPVRDYKEPLNLLNSATENNPTLKETISQEKPLSILEKSQLEKEKKLESERLAQEQKERIQKIKDKEQAELNAKIREQKNATLGKSELDRQITKSDNIPYKELENAPKSSVSLNDDEIHPLKFAIVNKSDLKPNFKNTGTQTRTAIDSKKIEEIANNFDPKLILGRGGFDDLPIILHDGQVIAGNHRTQGMLNFNARSRKKYERAIKENFNIELKPDELLVRMPENELDDKEIFKLASKSNENRANSFSDTLLSAMSSYNNQLKHLPPQFESDSVENLANQVARALEKDAKIPSQTQIENANLALLSRYATNTANNSFLEVFDNAYESHLKENAIPTEWGKNYSEFKGDGVGAINKLLETRSGYVEGAFHKQGLGDIDLVWGKGGKDGYGLEHILERRMQNNKDLKQSEKEKYALNIVKSIPNIIHNGAFQRDSKNRAYIEYQGIKIGLKDNWMGDKLKNKWVITAYEER